MDYNNDKPCVRRLFLKDTRFLSVGDLCLRGSLLEAVAEEGHLKGVAVSLRAQTVSQ